MEKTFQELDLNNSFLFAAALEDPETCQIVLEIILGHKVPKVKPHAEHSILVSSDFKSVRLDIYATDEMQVSYNIEAQNEDKGNLPKRSRFYQAEMDVSSLKPGEDYNNLKPSYVIFICTFDPFGEGLYQYTFEERCRECNIGLGDGTKKIFLNTKGKNDNEVPAELIHFLKYMENSTDAYVGEVTDDSIIRLHDKVTNLKKHRALEARFMTVEEWANQRAEEQAAKAAAEAAAEATVKATVKALADGVLMFLNELGPISQELEERISSENNTEILKCWLKLAAEAESVEQFTKEI